MNYHSSNAWSGVLLSLLLTACGTKGAGSAGNPEPGVADPGICAPTDTQTTEPPDPAVELNGVSTIAIADVVSEPVVAAAASSLDCLPSLLLSAEYSGKPPKKSLIGIQEDGNIVRLPFVGLAGGTLEEPSDTPDVVEIFALPENRFLIQFASPALLTKASKSSGSTTATTLFIMEKDGKLKGVVEPGKTMHVQKFTIHADNKVWMIGVTGGKSPALMKLDLASETFKQFSKDIETVSDLVVNNAGEVLYSGSINTGNSVNSISFSRRVKENGFETFPFSFSRALEGLFLTLRSFGSVPLYGEVVNDKLLLGAGGCLGEIVLDRWCWLSSGFSWQQSLTTSFTDLSSGFSNYAINPFANSQTLYQSSFSTWKPFDSSSHFLTDGRIQKWELTADHKLKISHVKALRFPYLSASPNANYSFAIYGEAHGFAQSPVVVATADSEAWFAPVDLSTGIVDWPSRIKLPYAAALRKFGEDILVVDPASYSSGLSYEMFGVGFYQSPKKVVGGSADVAATFEPWSGDQSVFKLIDWNDSALETECHSTTPGCMTGPGGFGRISDVYNPILCPTPYVLKSSFPVAYNPLDIYNLTGSERVAYAHCVDNGPMPPLNKFVKFKYDTNSPNLKEPTVTKLAEIQVIDFSSNFNPPLEFDGRMVVVNAQGTANGYETWTVSGTKLASFSLSDVVLQGSFYLPALNGLTQKVRSKWTSSSLFVSGTRNYQGESYRVDFDTKAAIKIASLDGIEVFSASQLGSGDFMLNGFDASAGEVLTIRFDENGTELSRRVTGGGVQRVYKVLEVK